MRRRIFSTVTVILAVIALGAVLYSATVVDRRPPSVASIRLSSPVDGDSAVGQALTAIDIRFSEPVRASTVESRLRITPTVPGAISWNGMSMAIFTPSERLPPDTEFTLSLDPGFEDLAGNAAASGVDAWTFRTVGHPAVVAVDPADGSTRVPVDARLTLRFDRLMDTEAVARSLRVEPGVTIQHAWSGQDLILEFGAPLLFGTTYTVTVGGAASDTSGTPLSTPFVMRFTTVAAGLQVERVIPTASVAGISVRSSVAVVFDGAIDPDSVQEALHITPSVDGALAVVDLPADDPPRDAPGDRRGDARVLLFTPSSTFAPNTTYSVTLDPVVRRIGGDGVAAGVSWSFTTGHPTLSAQNQIAFLSARSGVRNVWLMNPDGSNPRQLTSELAPVSGFDASGDGSMIAWASAGVVHVMQTDGSNERLMTRNDRREYAPRFLPDGRSLLIGRRLETGDDQGYWVVPLPGVLDIDERQVLESGAPPLGSSQLGGDGLAATDGTPPWASRSALDPSGERLLLTTAGGDVRLVSLSAPSGPDGPPLVDTGLVATAAPAWSPALDAFVVVGRRVEAAGSWLWVVDEDGGARSLWEATGSVAASTTGVIAFLVREPGGPARLTIGAATGSAPARTLTAGSTLEDRWPAFGPGGQVVLFGRLSPGAGAGSSGIWSVDVATGRLTRLSPEGSYPRWLP
jgi:hypothetical protein